MLHKVKHCVMYLSNAMCERSMIHISLKKAGFDAAQSQALCVMYLCNALHDQSVNHSPLKKAGLDVAQSHLLCRHAWTFSNQTFHIIVS